MELVRDDGDGLRQVMKWVLDVIWKQVTLEEFGFDLALKLGVWLSLLRARCT
jgi:hypothetical protein